MQGLQLAKAYFDAYGRTLIEGPLAPYQSVLAAGLVGEGSDCFGFDDAISQDHDFGPGFCLWLPDALYQEVGRNLQAEYDRLPRTFMGYERMVSNYGGGRVGVMSLEGFYERFTGLKHPPTDAMEWLRIPEDFLATATNGAVFYDPSGIFTAWRNHLLNFYPDDVMRKKLAAKCAVMEKSGQYNYPRCLKRGDVVAASFACSEFIQAAFGALYLLNGEYMPYYKWWVRGSERFTVLREAVVKLQALAALADTERDGLEKTALIESVCADVANYLCDWGYTNTREAFLQVQGEALMASIRDARLKGLHILVDR